jgi:anti-sigma factor RsiW
MDCLDAERALNESFDGALAPQEARWLAAHLGQCAACQAREQQMRAILGAEAQRPLEDPGPDFTALVMRRLRTKSRPAPFWKPATALAILGALLLGVNQLCLNGLRFESLLEVLEYTAAIIAAATGEIWQGLNDLSDAAGEAASQSSQWLLAPQASLLLLAGTLAALIILLAAARFATAKCAGHKGE